MHVVRMAEQAMNSRTKTGRYGSMCQHECATCNKGNLLYTVQQIPFVANDECNEQDFVLYICTQKLLLTGSLTSGFLLECLASS